jgi:mannose-6-phosphate isomerase-like protein (cupin superfamily)
LAPTPGDNEKGRQPVGISVVNIDEKFSKIDALHSYKIIARMNNYYFKLVRMKREFIWHKHPETDEVFMVIDGNTWTSPTRPCRM